VAGGENIHSLRPSRLPLQAGRLILRCVGIPSTIPLPQESNYKIWQFPLCLLNPFIAITAAYEVAATSDNRLCLKKQIC